MVKNTEDKTKDASCGSFVRKLFNMVENEPSDVVAWIRGGTAFHIKKTKVLSEVYLPKYFRHKRLSSLIRQLNFYSFYKVTEANSIIYQHSFFRKGRPDLLKNIRRRGAGKAKDPWIDPLASGAGTQPTHCTSPTSKHHSVDSMSPAHKPGVPTTVPPMTNLKETMKRALEISNEGDGSLVKRPRQIDNQDEKGEQQTALDVREFLVEGCSIAELPPAFSSSDFSSLCNQFSSLTGCSNRTDPVADSEAKTCKELFGGPLPRFMEGSLWDRPLSPVFSPENSSWSDTVF